MNHAIPPQHEAPYSTGPVVNCHGLRDALHILYPHAGFNCRVRPGIRPEVIAGETITLATSIRGAPVVWSVVRAPARTAGNPKVGSAQLTPPDRLQCTAPGLVVLRMTVDEIDTRDTSLVVWPAAALEAVAYPPSMAVERRTRLRAITAAAKDDAAVVQALESEPFSQGAFSVLVGRPKNASLNLRDFA